MESNKGLEDKTMFDEMRETGSNIPDKVKYLQEHGWQSYKHHDNWVKKDLKDWEKDLCNFDLNSAYEECLRKENELSNAIEVLCNALKDRNLFEDNGLKPQMLTTKKLEILKTIANSMRIDWDIVEENGKIISLNLKPIIK